jgi:hypothetical protein
MGTYIVDEIAQKMNGIHPLRGFLGIFIHNLAGLSSASAQSL